MNNVVHTIWKSEALRNHQVNRSFNMFYERIPTWRSAIPKITGYSIDEILRQASQNEKLDWAVVHGEGTVYRSQIKALEYTEEFIRSLGDDVLVAGHLIDKKGVYCGLHEQYLIVNLKNYRRLGQPPFGGYEKKEVELHNYQAGPSIHDDYTPKFLEPRAGRQVYRTWTCGWNFVSVSMEAGLRIPNIPDNIRNEKIYMYPDDNTERLLKNLDALYDMAPTDNISQNRVLMYWVGRKLGLSDHSIDKKMMASYAPRRASIFIYNTELLNPHPDWARQHAGSLSAFIGTCAGFLDICNMKHYGGFTDDAKLIYYDLNPDAVTFKKYLLDHFEGDLDQLPAFMDEFAAKHPHILIADNSRQVGYEDLRKEFDSPEEFRALWQKMRRLPREFVPLNLFNDYKKIAKISPAKQSRTLMCISDIFTGTNEMVYGLDNLKATFLRMISDLREYPYLIIQGNDTNDGPVMGYTGDLYRQYCHEHVHELR